MARTINIIWTGINIMITFYAVYVTGKLSWIDKDVIYLTIEIGLFLLFLFYVYWLVDADNNTKR